jgi:hypothetical protein
MSKYFNLLKACKVLFDLFNLWKVKIDVEINGRLFYKVVNITFYHMHSNVCICLVSCYWNQVFNLYRKDYLLANATIRILSDTTNWHCMDFAFYEFLYVSITLCFPWTVKLFRSSVCVLTMVYVCSFLYLWWISDKYIWNNFRV